MTKVVPFPSRHIGMDQEKPAERLLAEEMPAEAMPAEEMVSGEMLAKPVQVAGKASIVTERRVEVVTDKEMDSGFSSGLLTGERGALPLEKEFPESV